MAVRRRIPAVFEEAGRTYEADTCEPLKAAARRGALRLDAVGRGCYPGRAMPRGMLPGLCSAGVWDAPKAQGWGLDWHRNEGIELTYVSRGTLAFAVEGRDHRLRRGDLTITRPWQRHRVGSPGVAASRLAWLILDVGVRRPDQAWRWPDWIVCSSSDLRRLTKLLRQCERPVWRVGGEIGRCFERLAEAVGEAPSPSAATRLALHVNALLVALLDLLDRRRIPLDASLSSVQRTVELFLAALPRHLDSPWTLDAMARQCGLARSRFAHYCRQITNVSPMDYLTRCRVDVAARLLRAEPSRSVIDIAFDCGFRTSQYFATVFRAHLGCSPRDYRRAASRKVARRGSGNPQTPRARMPESAR